MPVNKRTIRRHKQSGACSSCKNARKKIRGGGDRWYAYKEFMRTTGKNLKMPIIKPRGGKRGTFLAAWDVGKAHKLCQSGKSYQDGWAVRCA